MFTPYKILLERWGEPLPTTITSLEYSLREVNLKVFCQGRYQRREIRDNELERLQKELREQADAASKRVVRQITPSLMRSRRQARFRNSCRHAPLHPWRLFPLL